MDRGGERSALPLFKQRKDGKMTSYTEAEQVLIERAYQAITNVFERDTHKNLVNHDHATWRQTERDAFNEREAFSRHTSRDPTRSRANICMAWFDGLNDPYKPARKLRGHEASYLKAFLLGTGHATAFRIDRDINADITAAKEACIAAKAAYMAESARYMKPILERMERQREAEKADGRRR